MESNSGDVARSEEFSAGERDLDPWVGEDVGNKSRLDTPGQVTTGACRSRRAWNLADRDIDS
jgi:hypothetical protein